MELPRGNMRSRQVNVGRRRLQLVDGRAAGVQLAYAVLTESQSPLVQERIKREDSQTSAGLAEASAENIPFFASAESASVCTASYSRSAQEVVHVEKVQNA